jgi:hypothetical protein
VKRRGGSGVPSSREGDDIASFAKTIGLDLIVRPDGEVVLIELQSHFGRLGLMRLHPSASRRHRQFTRQLRARYGTSSFLYEKMKRISSNKIETYRCLARYQPSSRSCHRWTSSIGDWAAGLRGDYLLIKPPRGSCGRGILVIPRCDFGRQSIPQPLTGPLLLQEYVESRRLIDGEGRPHLGCIRHIVHLYSDGRSLGFIHLPPYWRVAPAPFSREPAREAFTANISGGAFALPVEDADSRRVRSAAEKIVHDLMRCIFEGNELLPGPSAFLSTEGDLRTLRGLDG